MCRWCGILVVGKYLKEHVKHSCGSCFWNNFKAHFVPIDMLHLNTALCQETTSTGGGSTGKMAHMGKYNNASHSWCVFVRASLHMHREEKPTGCQCMLYCVYDTLDMFRALLCPSSGALDYMYAIAAYGVQCLAAGCRCQVQGSKVCVQEEGCCTTESCNIPDPRQPATKHCTP